MGNGSSSNGVNTKQLIWICVSFSVVLSLILTFHTSVFVPSIIHEVLHEVDGMIDRKTVSRNEWELILKKLESDRELVLKKLDNIEIEIRELRKERN